MEPPDEGLVASTGAELIGLLPTPGLLSRERLEERAFEAVSREPALKAALFRLVDVTPMCRDLGDVAQHLSALLGEIEKPSRPVRLASAAARPGLSSGVTGLAVRRAVRSMASRFIVGEDVTDARSELAGLWTRGVASTVDLLGEATVTEAEGAAYADRCERTLRELDHLSAGWSEGPVLERDAHGPIPRVNLSVKVSAMTPQLRAEDPSRGVDGARDHLRRLFRLARDLGAHLHVDMESLDLRESVSDLVIELLSEVEFRDGPSTGIVLQAYLVDSPEQLDDLLEWLRSADRSVPLTVRLVKGAYWDHEVVQAAQHGWPAPVFTERAECDRNFELLTRRLLAARDLVRVAIASHNLRSISHAIAAAEMTSDPQELEFQVLRGLGDDVQDGLARMNKRVRTYSPIGDLIAGMAYLVRRLLENTSNDSFLRVRAGVDDPRELLAAP
jgi:RHH-type proline utilization regulon transcriptional repressor/proline dehydrogenase/delta 1-pyrroline-5-carboxylate dehydrogenase